MRLDRLALAAPFALLLATPAAAGLDTYKDWVIGCDNTRSCTAIGHGGEEFVGGAGYVVVTRDAGPAAAAAVDVVLSMDSPPEGVQLVLSVDDPKAGLLPKGAARTDDNGRIRVTFTGDEARAFVAAVRNAAKLVITPRPGGSDAAATVSLAGMSAALLKMDDVQGRVGTTTALVRPGPKDAATVPAAPPAPVVVAQPMTELSGEAPKAVPRETAEETGCPADSAFVGVGLSGGRTLWGTCTSAGAYNYFYDFYVVDGGKAEPVLFPLPPGTTGAGNSLTNPGLDEGGKTLWSFDKGRGLGDCGVAARWAWDGTAFHLVEYLVMDDCYGIPLDDWPTLWRSTTR